MRAPIDFPVPKEWAELFARLMRHQPQLAAFMLDAEIYIRTWKDFPTACTDCRSWIRLNPDYIKQCQGGEHGPKGSDVFVLAHEIVHCMLFHYRWIRQIGKHGVLVTPKLLSRIRKHNPATAWREGMTLPHFKQVEQFALDYVINAMLYVFGLNLMPHGILFEPAMVSHLDNEDTAYATLFGRHRIEPGDPEPDLGATTRPGDAKPGCGGDDAMDDTTPGPDGVDERPAGVIRRKMALAECLRAMAKGAGSGSADLHMLLDRLVPNKVRWREFVQMEVKVAAGHGSQTWNRLRPRGLAMGTALQGKRGRSAGCVVFQADVSGSIDKAQKEQFAGAAVGALRQLMPKEIILLDVDTTVRQVRRPKDVNELTRMLVEDGFKGGGGTDMKAGFAWCHKNKVKPDTLITLTDGDLYGGWPEDTSPAKRALWVITNPGITAPASCGTSVYMPMDGTE